MGNKFQTKLDYFQKGLDKTFADLDRNSYRQFIHMKWISQHKRGVIQSTVITLEDSENKLAEAKAEGTALLTKMGLYAIIVDSIKRLKEMEEQ